MTIKTGYYDWHQFGLGNSFYPDDIPEDWKLSFYANEIECVQLNLSELDLENDVDDLFDDLPEQFELILYSNNIDQWEIIEELLNNEEVNVRALICNEQCLNSWSSSLKDYAVSVFCNSDVKTVEIFDGIIVKQFTDDLIKIVYIDESLDLKQWRACVEALVADKNMENYFMLLNATESSSAKASEIRLMIDMMGY